MTLLAAHKVNYKARIARTDLLISRHPFAAEILGFYRHIAAFQMEFYERLPKEWGKSAVAPSNGALRSELHISILLKPFARFLSLMESCAPAPIAAQAKSLKAEGEANWASTLDAFWKSGLQEQPDSDGAAGTATDALKEFLSSAFLQPYTEFVTGAMLPPALPMTTCRCPRCNSLPLLGVLRPEGDGGKRFLQCSFCSQEWEFRRIFCAHCGEDQEDKLPVYTAEQFPHIRIESCDTCKHFLRTIDLTKDGNAIPLVDDLGAIPLSLWAAQHGYRRIQSNLLGT